MDDKDPSTMTDEELAQVVNPEAEAAEPDKSQMADKPKEADKPAEEKVAEEAPEEKAEPEVTPPEEVAEEEELSPRAQKRLESLKIQEQIARLKQVSPQPSQSKRDGALDYATALDADPEVIKQLEADRTAEGQAQFNQGLERSNYNKWEILLNIDEPQIRAKYPELDPNNKEKYYPALAQAMATKFAMFSGYNAGDPQKGIPRTVQNPELRYADFVEGEMEFANELASLKNAQTVKNVARQAATTGLRPDGGTAKRLNLNKNPADMTTEELYAAIGQTAPNPKQ